MSLPNWSNGPSPVGQTKKRRTERSREQVLDLETEVGSAEVWLPQGEMGVVLGNWVGGWVLPRMGRLEMGRYG